MGASGCWAGFGAGPVPYGKDRQFVLCLNWEPSKSVGVCVRVGSALSRDETLLPVEELAL